MMLFRLARRRYPAAVPGQPATRRARPAAPRGPWLTTVAGTCLADVLAGWPAVLAGQGPSAGTAAGGAGAAVIGYDVYMGTSSHGESASPVSGGLITGTSYTVSGLANGTTYYFTADAVNRANLHSAVSAEASATPAAPVTTPGAPRGL